MKKKLLALLAVVLCLSAVSGVTAAYYTARDKAHNVITTGNVDIDLVEQQEVNGDLVPYPSGPIQGVMPGISVSKIVTVNNTGSGNAWIRVRVTREFELAEDAPEKLPAGGDPALIHLDIDTANWKQRGEWYYYIHPLAPGKSTTRMFENVLFDKAMGNAYQGCTANVIVEAQAVQVKNNGAAVLDANGWPAAK